MSFVSKRVLFSAAMLASTLSLQTFAATGSGSAGSSGTDFSAVRARRAMADSPQKASAATGTAKELVANSYRTYPQSCFSDTLPSPATAIQPLPVTPSGTLYTGTVTLSTLDSNGNPATPENVTVTVWRVACSSSGDVLSYNPDGGYVGATLMNIQRSAQEGTAPYPTYPDVRVSQGSIAFDNPNYTDYVRSAPEPNTVVSDTIVGSPVIYSTTYVLENYANPSFGFFYFNNAFAIRFDGGQGQVIINVPDYAPTQQTYPAAYQPMAVNGYLTGSWYDPAHGGEGMLTQVFDKDSQTRTFFATWYTFDSLGLPFWLVAQADFPIGSTQLQNVPVLYATGGGFAGNFTPPVTRSNWGTISVSFSDCQHIQFSYNGATSSSVSGGPGGSGQRTWSRLGDINSLNCQ
jgi:hypothetical protein